jgi:hypothetical protein
VHLTCFKATKTSNEEMSLKCSLAFPTGWRWCFIPVWAASVFCGLRLSPLPSCRSVCLTCLLNRSFRLHRQTQTLLLSRPPPTALGLSREKIPEASELRGLLVWSGGLDFLAWFCTFFWEPLVYRVFKY